MQLLMIFKVLVDAFLPEKGYSSGQQSMSLM